MTTPLILPNDNLIRKYRVDDLLEGNNRQYNMKSNGERTPGAQGFSFPSKYEEDRDNSISLYAENLLQRANVSLELVYETQTRSRNPSGIKYAAFRVTVQALDQFSDMIDILYSYDSQDPITQRGLCHVNITLKEIPGKIWKSKRNDWATATNALLDAVEVIDTTAFRFV